MSGFSDCFVDEATYVRIDAELDTIEREQGVRILLAVESGCRAWRFPSQDSDYDVRFLYLRPIETYLAVSPKRDVIERPIDATLDVNGWDLRKAFQLLLRSNAVLIEWLCSPVRYREAGTATARLLELARSSADLIGLAYHYDRQARRTCDEIAAMEEVRLKTYCYALRSALALAWVRDIRQPPPMDLPSLMAGLSLPDEVEIAITDLVARKADATVRDTTHRIPVLDQLIGSILAEPIRTVASPSRPEVLAQADALFASIVLDDYRKIPAPHSDR
jgi:uncharacterized protein